MEFSLLDILAIFGILLFVSVWGTWQRVRKYPPGPWGIPFFGCVFSVGAFPCTTFTKWAQQYRKIVSVRMGCNLFVILNDAKLIRELFNDPAFSGRPNYKTLLNLLSCGKHGILAADGKAWHEHRRFTIRTLRDLGYGRKQTTENLILEQVSEVVAWLRGTEGQSLNLHRKFTIMVLNSLWCLIAGDRFPPFDRETQPIMDNAMETYNELVGQSLVLFYPQFAERFGNLFGWTRMLNSLQPLMTLFDQVILEHEQARPQEGNEDFRDLIDAYLREIDRTTDPGSEFYGEKGKRALRAVVGDLHGAGSETTSLALNWALLYLATHLPVQEKMRKEIWRVIGSDRLPSLLDRDNMPYMEAMILETLRLSSVFGMGSFHTTMRDTTAQGFVIPKDTTVVTNLYWVHHNPEIWPNPDEFNPERFLSSDMGGLRVRKQLLENLLPFSTGKRVCLGESLARDTIFLFLASIFQVFEIRPSPSCPNPSLEPDVGFLSSPRPFEVVVKCVAQQNGSEL